MDLFLIDAIGPFFLDYDKRVVNWSKVPFVNLEKDGWLDTGKINKILKAFESFLRKISHIGYNGITLDDIAHLVEFDFYPDHFKQKIKQYRGLYREIFAIAADLGIKIFLNTDVMFHNEYIRQEIKDDAEEILKLFQKSVKQVLNEFEIDGVILRIGEIDGEDVIGDFKSEILLKTPAQANFLIKALLPIFEEKGKTLIFRNWTVGSYPIGDLIWNRDTHIRTFEGIESDHFIVSLKYGDTDFFSHLALNPLFLEDSHNMIIELQTRRERECFGVFPNFVGWEYENYFNQLKDVKNLVGISVWCQTGGWSRNKNLTFIENSSIWNELNTIATINIFKHQATADETILHYFDHNDLYLKFLKTFNDVFSQLLYIEDFSQKSLYFRRTRIPPLLWLTWDYVTINPLMTSIYTNFTDQIKVVDEAKIEQIYHLGKFLGIEGIEYCYDTLRMFLLCRKTLLGQYEAYRLLEHIGLFRRKYHPCNFKFSIRKGKSFVFLVKILFKIFTRSKSRYRLVDRMFLNPTFAFVIYKLVMFSSKEKMPKFSNKRAMKLDTLFR